MIDWNVVVTVRQDFNHAIALLRKLGAVERTGLFNVLVMRVPDARNLLEQIAGDPVRYVESREDDGARMLNVRDAMADSLVTVRGDRPLTEVSNKLADERVGALPVVDADGKPIGIVSYVDALRALAP